MKTSSPFLKLLKVVIGFCLAAILMSCALVISCFGALVALGKTLFRGKPA